MGAFMKANEAFNKLANKVGPAARKARNYVSSLNLGPTLKSTATKMDLMSGGFAMQADLYGGAGAAAGYAYGGDQDSMLKGAGLGVLGAVGHRGYKAIGGWGGVKSGYAKGKGLLANGGAGLRNAWQNQLEREAMTTSYWQRGMSGPASPWVRGARGPVSFI